MTTGKLNRYGTLAIVLLIAAIIIGGIIIWTRYNSDKPVEISLAPAPALSGEIYIGGAVSNPGIYPLKAEDSVEALIQAAGGTNSNANLTRLTLHISEALAPAEPQKININRAELWLLEALPGIGQVRAQAIIDYRQQNGLFHNVNELAKVDGIGNTTYEPIKQLITVAD